MGTAAVARSYLESFATADPDAVATHVTDDFINEHTAALSSGCEGKDEYRRRLPGFLATFAGLRYEIEDLIAQDDRRGRCTRCTPPTKATRSSCAA